MVIKEIKRVVVFLHPGQLASGNYFPVVFLDCDANFEECLASYATAVKIYDGPPNGSVDSGLMEKAFLSFEDTGELESDMAVLQGKLTPEEWQKLSTASIAEILGSLSIEKVLKLVKQRHQ